MAYTPNPTDVTQPTDDIFAASAAAEFRAIKGYLNGIVAAGLPAQPAGGGVLQTDGTTISWLPFQDFFAFNTFI
jgi:hypothetical protein